MPDWLEAFVGRHKTAVWVGGLILLIVANANDIYLFLTSTVPDVIETVTHVTLPDLSGLATPARFVFSAIGVVLLLAVFVDSRRAPRKQATPGALATRPNAATDHERPDDQIAGAASTGRNDQPDLRRAVDTLITWLFREEQKYERQPNEAWTRAPAPVEYGQELYELLGMIDPYAPAKSFAVAPKPGFEKPDLVPVWDVDHSGDEGAANPWMPDLADFSTITLTSDDLDTNASLVLGAAKHFLAPDAQIKFLHMRLAPEPGMAFLAWSKLADKACLLDAGPYGVAGPYDRDSVWSAEKPPSDSPVSDWPDPPLPPWLADGSWLDLVRFVGYRIRPFIGTAMLLASAGRDTTWSVETQAEGDFNVDVFWLDDGHLLSRREHRG